MIISRTPYRISFFGGGTDYPSWYLKNGGHVIATTIDKYNYISCRYLPPFFEHRFRLIYTIIEQCNNVEQIIHPSAKALLKYLNIKNGLEIHYDGDLPARSGIGSSSAFTVGLLNALNKFNGIKLSKKFLAQTSIHIEQNIIKEIVGSQDQISAAYGGLNYIKFTNKGNFVVKPINISKEKIKNLEKKLMLFHTGIYRTAETVTKNYVKDFDKKSLYLEKMYSIVPQAMKILSKGNLDDFGHLLNETWLLKKNVSRYISNYEINKIYDCGLKNGAYGGKLLGAGGGGFLIFYVPEKKQKKVKEALSNLLYIPFKFENSGSQIIYDKPHKQYKKEEKIRLKQKLKTFRELKNF